MKAALANLLHLRDRRRIAFEVEQELQFHLQMLEHKFTQHGMSPADARAAALRRFGNPDRIRNECVEIRERNSPLQRVLKTLSILLALTGLAIHVLNSDFKVARVGDTLIMIAISGRLLLYVRGLRPSTLLFATKEASLSVVTEPPEHGSH
jgi:hypothetical protein